MKQKFILVILIISISMAFFCPVNYSDESTIKVFVNNQQVIFIDQNPITIENRTFVPLRAVFEKMGCDVSWNDKDNCATVSDQNCSITVTIDSPELTKATLSSDIEGTKNIKIDVAPRLINSRVMVPLRAITEALDCKVDWDEDTNTVNITYIATPLSTPAPTPIMTPIPSPTPTPTITPMPTPVPTSIIYYREFKDVPSFENIGKKKPYQSKVSGDLGSVGVYKYPIREKDGSLRTNGPKLIKQYVEFLKTFGYEEYTPPTKDYTAAVQNENYRILMLYHKYSRTYYSFDDYHVDITIEKK